ncbi:MAG TPA: 6,7-dimethyl-8-ribityllumazine synthase [Dysgonamonadaceae bacterium]|jgi:6,7-dimethyl-8-ribityllumazine synthase|nr:6,7-dimethyl-8-ribityllumazine synthase [Dysgonamonadaceae bacterium]
MSTLIEKSRNQNASLPNGKDKIIGIVVSEWNSPITENLLKGAVDTLVLAGVKKSDIIIEYVPGSVELTLGAQTLLEGTLSHAIIVLGCVVQGETAHFDYVCDSVTQGITTLNIEYNTPVIFGVLTTNNQEQAEARAGGTHGNKGEDCAIAALKMIALQEKYRN